MKINFYIIRLFKENAIYIIFLIIILVLTVVLIPLWLTDFSNMKSQIDSTRVEIDSLKKRKELLVSLITSSLDDVKEYNVILDKLIPSVEDYFSIIYVLEKLSQDTNFRIDNYVVDLSSSIPEHLSLTVTGAGEANSFIKFLSEYNLGGGRLVTMTKFNFNSQNSQYKLDLIFYSKAMQKGLEELSAIPQEDFGLMKKVRNKVQFLFKTSEELQPQDLEYETTDDLF